MFGYQRWNICLEQPGTFLKIDINRNKEFDSHTKAHNDQGNGENSRSAFMLNDTRQSWHDQDNMTDESNDNGYADGLETAPVGIGDISA